MNIWYWQILSGKLWFEATSAIWVQISHALSSAVHLKKDVWFQNQYFWVFFRGTHTAEAPDWGSFAQHIYQMASFSACWLFNRDQGFLLGLKAQLCLAPASTTLTIPISPGLPIPGRDEKIPPSSVIKQAVPSSDSGPLHMLLTTLFHPTCFIFLHLQGRVWLKFTHHFLTEAIWPSSKQSLTDFGYTLTKLLHFFRVLTTMPEKLQSKLNYNY